VKIDGSHSPFLTEILVTKRHDQSIRISTHLQIYRINSPKLQISSVIMHQQTEEKSNDNELQKVGFQMEDLQIGIKGSVKDEFTHDSYQRKICHHPSGLTEIFEYAVSETIKHEETYEIILHYRKLRAEFTNVIQLQIDDIVESARGFYEELNNLKFIIAEHYDNFSSLIEAQIFQEFEQERIMMNIQNKIHEQRHILRTKPPFVDIKPLKKILLDGQMVADYIINTGIELSYDHNFIHYNNLLYPIDVQTKLMLDVCNISVTKESILEEQKARKEWHLARNAWMEFFDNCKLAKKYNHHNSKMAPNIKKRSLFLQSIIGQSWPKRKIALDDFMSLL
jgi:hypothetical protein